MAGAAVQRATLFNTDTGVFVEVAVTVHGITLSQLHPVRDGKNRPILAPTAFDINTSIQRCLVKAIALHGLGLYIYAGEDLPAANDESKAQEPPLTDRDTVERTDPVWKLAAGLYVVAKKKADEAATELETIRARLVGLVSNANEAGFGVSVTRYWKLGSVEYKRIPELKGVNLDRYRAAGREAFRVTVAK